MKESKVEKHLRLECEARDILCYKFTSPGHNGVPDRILIGQGKTIYVETKAPGKVPRALQEYQHKKFRNHGAVVYVLDTIEKIDNFFKTKTEFK